MNPFLFSINEEKQNKTDNNNFCLHTHKEYEIYLFLSGDAKFIVEDKEYNLEPYDIIIIRKNQLHRVFHNKSTFYHSISISISPEFFNNFNCMEYENIFLDTSHKLTNKIPAKTVLKSGIADSLKKLKKYTNNFNDISSPVVSAAITEILYFISAVDFKNNISENEKPVQKVISYLNDNYSSEISLDMLSGKFFLSKYYLCRCFKKSTGMTISEYINQKKLLKAKELIKSGHSISESAFLSGYRDYSSFYRAYKKVYNISPGVK